MPANLIAPKTHLRCELEAWERNQPPVRNPLPSVHAIDHQCKGAVIMALRKKVLAR